MTTDPTGGWAKATEEAGSAARTGLEVFRDLGRFVAPAFRPLVGMAADQFEMWRSERQVRFADRYQESLRNRGLSGATRRVSPAFLLPLLERASIEDDDDLQDIWAMMLANASDASSDIERRTAFIGMLAEMTRFDVLILSRLHAATPSDPWVFLETHKLPDTAIVADQSGREIRPPRRDVEVSLGNLSRLGCLNPISTVAGYVNFGAVKLTELGVSFIKACS